MLDELLARHTTMPVRAIEDGTVLEANIVYVIQRATTVNVDAARFFVENRPIVDAQGPVPTIDTLFKSMAENWARTVKRPKV